ncbi:MAG: hypothetical protein WB995_04530, partial [Candidatus Acidiferrales bacterium]
ANDCLCRASNPLMMSQRQDCADIYGDSRRIPKPVVEFAVRSRASFSPISDRGGIRWKQQPEL